MRQCLPPCGLGRPLFRPGLRLKRWDCAGSCRRQQQRKHNDKNETQVYPLRFVDHGMRSSFSNYGSQKTTQLIAGLTTFIDAGITPRTALALGGKRCKGCPTGSPGKAGNPYDDPSD